MRGRGACMVGVCVAGCVCVCVVGACMAGGIMHGRGACEPQQIPQDMVNERAVCILLECILVLIMCLFCAGSEKKMQRPFFIGLCVGKHCNDNVSKGHCCVCDISAL